MFEYAFARALQLQTNNKLCFNLSSFKNDNSGRTYSLYNMNLPKVKIQSDFESKLSEIKRKLIIKSNKISSDSKQKTILKNYICVLDEYYYKDISDIRFDKNIIVSGFFQSYKFFDKYRNIIIEELSVKTAPDDKNAKMLEQINKDNAVCVHIRRGDYLDERWKSLNVCDYDYYIKSMKSIAEKTESPVFYVFSNSHEDIEWIKKNYKFDFNVKYVDLSNPDYEELRLMYSCKHFIISNSTYSWWAQYLCKSNNKLVVAPSVWNRKNGDWHNLYMPNWITTEV